MVNVFSFIMIVGGLAWDVERWHGARNILRSKLWFAWRHWWWNYLCAEDLFVRTYWLPEETDRMYLATFTLLLQLMTINHMW